MDLTRLDGPRSRPNSILKLLSMEAWAAAKKKSVSVAVPPVPVRVSSQRPLAPSVASVTSVANDKGDNEMIPRAVHRSGICLITPNSIAYGTRRFNAAFTRALQ